MRLVFRRARGATGLLLAATGATLIATALLTGLASYGRTVVDSGARSAVAAASQEERSILIRGSAGGTEAALTERDAAMRARFADGLAGVPTSVSTAGLAAGRQLSGPTGTAVPDDDGVVFASVVFLDDLATHADLVAGAWPQPDGRPVQAALAEPVARILRVGVGDQIPITDRVTRQVTRVTVVGVWAPRDARDPYWRLVPDVLTGVTPGSATYGPLVVDRADFLTHFVANASVAWLLEPDLTRATVATLDRLATAAQELGTKLPEEVGLGSSGLATARIDRLAERLARADLVGRSALVTPMLLVVVLGGYALLLVALLLTEQRRGETALLRARGAGRGQLAGLAVREALLVVLPAAALAPPLAALLTRLADQMPVLTGAALHLRPRLDPVTWLIAGLAAAGCLLAMLGPALRRGGTYVGELAARSRPSRRTVAQRAGVDVALVALAMLGWFQLRQYSSPLAAGGAGTLAIDPLLATAPTAGVLAGAVLALRGLPPLARLVERVADRRSWTATTFGMWQAGRRPHAGPVLLLALAVAVSTLAWCLAATSAESLADQADHQVGTDLRLVEASGEAPPERADQLAGLPEPARILPAWRDELRLGADGEPTEMLALTAAAAGPVVRYRADLADGDPGRLFTNLAAAAVTAPLTGLPADARRLTGRITTASASDGLEFPVRSVAVVVDAVGAYRRVPLGESGNGTPLRFDVELPARGGPLRLAGFLVEGVAPPNFKLDWHLADLGTRAEGQAAVRLPLRDPGSWRVVTRGGAADPATAGDGTLRARYAPPPATTSWLRSTLPLSFAIVPAAAPGPVPVVATADALAALGMTVGGETTLTLAGAAVPVRVVGRTAAVPGVPTSAALLVDLPSLGTRLFHEHGLLRAPQEWWVATGPDDAAATARQAATFDGLRVLDRSAVAAQARSDPYGVGARVALFGAALGAILLATVGIGVDIRATARRRITELAVLRTLGAGFRTLTRALLVEQGFLAGLGVLVGLVVGIGVAAAMAPLTILTPSAQRPVPAPLLEIAWLPVGGTALLLLLVALGLSGLTAVTLPGRLSAAQARIGEDR
ncbi:FtsX-like permease family protein [Micromonospora sp. HM5-17]|uniref:FtsX-like permease family protein n=1 Tax=Micromonospora sp. HM5-17 TaxID=2487710 RepID=UPI000F465B12|nr:FtsX-like permease family protein [Micromonospora sp. HM5-17]ROT33790.1 FtsX-like permease family protein [Micromonospora sp. HM5-17]